MSNPPGQKTAPLRRRKWRWTRRFVFLLLFLCLLGTAINGPVARWFVGRVLLEKLSDLGMQGELRVEGHLSQGFTLHDGIFSGSGELERLQFEEISFRYQVRNLLRKQIDSLTVNRVVVVLKSSPGPGKDAQLPLPALSEFGTMLRRVRTHILPVEISAQDIDVTLRRPEAMPLELTLQSLTHSSGSSAIFIGALETNALGPENLRRQDLNLQWEEEHITLGRTTLLPDLAVDYLTLDLPRNRAASLHTLVDSHAGDLEMRADESGTVAVALRNGVLDLSKLSFIPGLRLAGTVETLRVDLENVLKQPSQWTGRAEISAKGLTWPQGSLLAVSAHCELGEQLLLKAELPGRTEVTAHAPRPSGDTFVLERWLEELPVQVEIKAPALHAALEHLIPATGQELPRLETVPDGALSARGTLTVKGQGALPEAKMQWSFSDILHRGETVPDLTGSLTFSGEGEAAASASLAHPRPGESLQVAGQFDLESNTYRATLDAEFPDSSWIAPFIPRRGSVTGASRGAPTGNALLWRPREAVMLEWSGGGSLSAPHVHRGTLSVSKLALRAPRDTIAEVVLEARYNWPDKVEITDLQIRNEGLLLQGRATWAEDTIRIPELQLRDEDGVVAKLHGHAPLSPRKLSIDKYFGQKAPLRFQLEGNELVLSRLAKLIPLKIPEDLETSLDYSLILAGSPGSPTLDGKINAREVRVPGPGNLPPMASTITFATEDQHLNMDASITEPGGRILDLAASVPVNFLDWVEDPEAFQKLPVTAHALLDDFALSRLQIFVPQLAEARGHLDASINLTGTVGTPDLTGSAVLDLEHLPLPPGLPHRELRDSRLIVRLKDSRTLVVDPTSVIHCAAGRIGLSGIVTMPDREPTFDLKLDGQSLLAWRNDSFILRNHAQLSLTGPLHAATISGNIQLVDSLFFQDVELLPLGVPTEHVPKPQLPAIDQNKADRMGGLPRPFAAWKLNVTIGTETPILIRSGNFASGEVHVRTRVGGTLANPRPTGTITVRDAWARLPLAGKLNLQQGIVTLRPDTPYDPALNLRGSATIDRYNITLNIFGSASAPKYSLFSDPPLPESEILTLLATGSTTGDLENLSRDAATMKLAQFATTWVRDRFKKPGKPNTPMQRFLVALDDIQLNVGENDPFSGRKRNSATLKLTDKVFLSAAVDATGNTRGLVIFSVRFR